MSLMEDPQSQDPWELLQIPKTPVEFPKTKVPSFFHVKMVPDPKLDRNAILEHVKAKIYGQCSIRPYIKDVQNENIPLTKDLTKDMTKDMTKDTTKDMTKDTTKDIPSTPKIRRVIHPVQELIEAREEREKSEPEELLDIELELENLTEEQIRKKIKFSDEVKFIVMIMKNKKHQEKNLVKKSEMTENLILKI